MSIGDVDGMLEEWGTRLFFGMPKKAKGGGDGKLSGAVTAAGAALASADRVRAHISAAVRPNARQVVVKITGGGRGMKAVAAHFRYISRLGKPEVGGKGQTLELEDENGDKVTGREGLEGLEFDWRVAGSLIPDESHRREVFNIVLSMPDGTPAPDVLGAAREFARDMFEGHKYVFALHDDTGSPHVHLAVRAERSDGRRLNPRKADLARWRERFAARLQDRGINAVATRASTRGVTQAPKELWRIGGAKRVRKPRSNSRSAVSVSLGRQRSLEAWGHVASALARSSDSLDQELFNAVRDYVVGTFGTEARDAAFERVLSVRPDVRGGGSDISGRRGPAESKERDKGR